MNKTITKDGSITYYNEEAGDYYHSKSGAKEEAVEKHAKSLNIKPKKIIFDVCFGLGYNTAAALDIGPATVYCFENDKNILKKILEIDADFKSFKIIKEFINGFLNGNNVYEKFCENEKTRQNLSSLVKPETKVSNFTNYEKDGVKLIMLFGDAREQIKKVKEKADYVFFDPFSPAKVPEMWTEEFFKDIRNKMENGGKLSTYSCAGWVRNNMQNAGFEVMDGPIIGRKSPSTICIAHRMIKTKK